MKMYTHKKRTNKKPWIIAGVLAAGLIVYLAWPEDTKPSEPQSEQPAATNELPSQSSPAAGVVGGAPRAPQTPSRQSSTPAATKTPAKPAGVAKAPSRAATQKKAYGPKGMTVGLSRQIGPSILTVKPVTAEQASQDYAKGWALYKQGKSFIESRTLLNRALNSGKLAAPQAVIARRALEDLANKTIFNNSTYVNPKDPYLVSYKFLSGDSLNSKRNSAGQIIREGIISKYNLCVPWRIIPFVNGLGFNATKFRAGQNYKLVKGPFHVVVYKSQRVADIYLRDLFIKRVAVAIGAAETPSPEGFFRVVCWTGKTANSTYYPPAEMGGPCIPVRPGQPGYPLGPKGYNIKIEGIPELDTTILASQSYALHGTNNPASLGSAASRGCIRFGDRDIEFLYAALMDYADPKNPRANWNHWSTVTIRP